MIAGAGDLGWKSAAVVAFELQLDVKDDGGAIERLWASLAAAVS